MYKHQKQRRKLPLLWIAMIAIFLTGLGLIIMGVAQHEPSPVTTADHSPAAVPATTTPTATHDAVSPTLSVLPSKESVTPLQASTIPVPPVKEASIAALPSHMSFPAAGIEVDVQSMDGTSYELDPPPDGTGHWLNNYGKAGVGATDTVYVIGHSCYGVGCTSSAFPFNHLSESSFKTGDVITLTTTNGEKIRYDVTNTCRYDKRSTSTQKCGTWDEVPGRLVVISCYTQDPLGTNVAVFATIEK